jgi:hypothetical protein
LVRDELCLIGLAQEAELEVHVALLVGREELMLSVFED